jgi:esterase
MQLHLQPLTAAGATPTAGFVFLHGILGQGKNLTSLARRLVEARPDLEAVLVDLRAHGQSQGGEGRDTVAQAALDVAESVQRSPLPVVGALGHSFGGKVALLVAEHLPALEHLVLLDSSPGPREDARGSELTVQVLSTLDRLPPVFETREGFIEALLTLEIPRSIGGWLAMNLVRDVSGLRFGLSLARVRALLESYFTLDGWPALERLATGDGPAVHLVIGERSAVFDQAERARAVKLAEGSKGRLTVDLLPTGHWVHVDDFEGTVRALLARVERSH